MIRKLLLLSLLLFTAISCKEMRKVTDLVDPPTARELYARQFKEDYPPYQLWKRAYDMALEQRVEVSLPYVEKGLYDGDSYPVYSYDLVLQQGEILHVSLEADSSLVFMDLLRMEEGGELSNVARNVPGESNLEQNIDKEGIYTLVIQPEMGSTAAFNMQAFRRPQYEFPVAGKDNDAIHSFWGDARDGGRRSHQGIDIFAARGTPVVAATEGRVSSTGERGLGGKQVWLRSGLMGNSLYYAHLDSIIARPGQKVSRGDTLGLVGNTGNAKTTPPHLHFGIYRGYRGALNPLPYVLKTIEPKDLAMELDEWKERARVKSARANLRLAPTVKSKKLAVASRQDTLEILGTTTDWLHVRSGDSLRAYVHKSLLEGVGV